MSLLEDILHLLQSVLEYFGVPPDMLVPVWESQLCGQYRSVVRMIGTNLPLTPNPRVHFQIPLHTYRPHGYVDVTMDSPAIPSLADVLWVAEDEGDSFAKFRNGVHRGKQDFWSRGGEVSVAPQGERMGEPRLAAGLSQKIGPVMRQRSEPDALRKITALEDELLKLRAQIAMIVTAAPPSGSTQNVPGTPGPLMSPPPPPILTSTPRCAPPPPPPPPPAPPPPSSGSSLGTPSMMELIRQRRETSKASAQGKGQTPDNDGQLPPQDHGVPSMLDVLKDLNQVKLRTVERSPGGTPARKRRSQCTVLANDPAALIAAALKRKFAHRRHNDSNDKENCSAELSPFGSPETQIPQVSRRSQGRLHR